MVGKRYEQGPFAAGAPTQGDQLGLTMRERYRLGVDGMQAYARKVYQKDFKTLAPEEQDRILKDMEAGSATEFTGITGQQFFQLLLGHVKAGFFADPIYGGNRDMVGWKLIGYPGAQIVYADWISRYGEKFTGPYLSLVDHQEHQH
jgi:gluconate 2-dehydrogenase gamma chain